MSLLITIDSCLALTAGASQQHTIENLVKLLEFSGFLRDKGFLNLVTVQKFCEMLNIDNLQFKVRTEKIRDFCRKGKKLLKQNCIFYLNCRLGTPADNNIEGN